MVKIITYYADYFLNDKNDGYLLLKSSVCLIILNNLYERFLIDGSATDFLDMDENTVEEYKSIAMEYYSDENLIFQAAKAAYVLNLITAA